ncbi:GNAT family N-acetyltransferase [Lagierella sp.]|uniref:GNAT family N-acetyltransferase n=1 Tax=Lagierella sp. TaxID=2849657 RepID=UPI002617012E|nr:GNAT family N-acetyltransferase [Lagierella sp.]
MKTKIIEIQDKKIKEEIATEILYDLPEWFGLPDSTRTYIEESKNLPFIACYFEERLAGFIVLKETGQECSEIFVMGVLKEFHKKGVGKALNRAYENLAREMGYIYSQVKTVQSGHYREYDITNEFYRAMGYSELECFPDMWDEWNPCQIYVKYLGKR